MNSIAHEARLIMPVEATAKSAALHKEMAKDIARAFGGYTQTSGRGGWVDDDGGLIEEDVVIYDIAMPMDGATKLHNLALRWGRRFEQQAVYVRYPDGEVHIHDVKAEEGLNAAEQAFHDRTMKGAPSVTSVPAGVGERVFGTKRLPKVGEVWSTVAGGTAAVVSKASILDGGYNVVVLMPGSTALPIGYTYTVDLDGYHMRGHDNNAFDLNRFVSAF